MKTKRILVVVDMQNDFIDGSLGTKEAQAIVERVMEKIESYDKGCIYATRDTHGPDYLETQEGRNLPVKHCIKGTGGWMIERTIADLLKGAVIVDKPTFGSRELANMLAGVEALEDIEIELVGLCTDICVISNALLLKAKMPEVPITVDASCCAGATPEGHEAALRAMESCQIRVLRPEPEPAEEA